MDSNEYVSCACNQSPHVLDWGFNGKIAYGACNAVSLYIPEKNGQGGRVVEMLVAHKNLVTSVHWIRLGKGNPEQELISTSADKTAIIWTFDGCQVNGCCCAHGLLVATTSADSTVKIWKRHEKSGFVPAHILSGHGGTVETATALYVNAEDHGLLVATTSADSTVKIWRRHEKSVTCCQTISFGNGFGLDVSFTLLESSRVPILAVGCHDSKVRLYIPDETQHFTLAVTLEGHENWIRSLDFTTDEDRSLLLASASQDQFIRIWRISLKNAENSNSEDGLLKVKENLFSIASGDVYSVSLESVLSGHEDRIYGAKWRPYHGSNSTASHKRLQILSTSMDKTMIVWEPDPVSKIWFEKVRVGEVGGNTLGFYGGVFSPDGTTVIGHVFHGAVLLWNFDKKQDCWHPGVCFGGHSSPVQDIDWDSDGEFLLSCSEDQTTRLHAPFIRDNGKSNWHEIARPQVHGYDMVCLSVLGRYKFISSGDEKVLRVFEAPRSFADNLKNICKLDTSSYVTDLLPDGASVPSLGLSNKAVYEEDIVKASMNTEVQKHAKDHYPEFYYTPVALSAPPTEELLIQNTLWPEVQKLYGHPYEIYAVASNHSKTIVASSCKASKPEHAAIILWNVATWKQLGQLVFHKLTVTQMEFSPDDEYLLSVSRDRMWALYRHFPDQSPPYMKVADLGKGSSIHTRIIWSCTWSHDSLHFSTASRDKKVAVWTKNTKAEDSPIMVPEFSLSSVPLETEDSATAVSFAPCCTWNGRYLMAVGLENGHILIYTWHNSDENAFPWDLVLTLNNNIAHHLNVNRLKFSPVLGKAGQKKKDCTVVQLASCSADRHVKVYNISYQFLN